jgi:hypothetical protein
MSETIDPNNLHGKRECRTPITDVLIERSSIKHRIEFVCRADCGSTILGNTEGERCIFFFLRCYVLVQKTSCFVLAIPISDWLVKWGLPEHSMEINTALYHSRTEEMV